MSDLNVDLGRFSMRPRVHIVRKQFLDVPTTEPSTAGENRAAVGRTFDEKAASILKKPDWRYGMTYPGLKWKSPECRKRRRSWRSQPVSAFVGQLESENSSIRRGSTGASATFSPSVMTRAYRIGANRTSSNRLSVIDTPVPIHPKGSFGGRASNRHSDGDCSVGAGGACSNPSESPKSDVGDGARRSSEVRSDILSENEEESTGANEAPPRKRRKRDSVDESATSHDAPAPHAKATHIPTLLQTAFGFFTSVGDGISDGICSLLTNTYKSTILGNQDLAATSNGASVIFWSAKSTKEGEASELFLDEVSPIGWKTEPMTVTNPPQHEWCIVRLAQPGVVKGILIDTTKIEFQTPMAISIEAAYFQPGELESDIEAAVKGTAGPADAEAKLEAVLDGHSLLNSDQWKDIRPVTFVTGPGVTRHRVTTHDRIQTHARINLFVTGEQHVPRLFEMPVQKSCEHPEDARFSCGISRLGIYGEPVDPSSAVTEEPLEFYYEGESTRTRSSLRTSPQRPTWMRFRRSLLPEVDYLPKTAPRSSPKRRLRKTTD